MIERLLSSVIRQGTLRIVSADGGNRCFGSGPPEVFMKMRQSSTLRRIGRDPEFMLGQTYMDQAWDAGDLRKLLQVLMVNFPRPSSTGLVYGAKMLVLPLLHLNRMHASRRNVAHHYDLDETLFRLFLDQDMQYSCAYFAPGVTSLEEAQQAKCAHILRKLKLRPGQHVLDIGCGWGGLAMYLAEQAGVSVTGLTLSREQARVARARIAERGLQQQVRILLQDYRAHHHRYDRIVSVGMFEHVGKLNYRRFFNCVHDMLNDEGIALVHTIGRSTPPSATNPWVQRYIFPGGYIPAMSEVLSPVERSGMLTTDVEILRLHYADTLAEWYRRFQASREEIRRLRGERFCRMWEFYLAGAEGSFRCRDMVVFQLQLSRRVDSLPLTRDYLYLQSTEPRNQDERRSAAS